MGNYDKMMNIVRKIGPTKLNMHKDMMVCMERSVKFPDDKNTVVLVKPNPAYPKYEEKVIDYVKYIKK